MTGFPSDTPSVPASLGDIEEVLRRLGEKRVAVFSDYDGTLTPIVARPELAVLDEDMRETLRRLAAHCTTAIISGRSLEDVRDLVGIEELYYAGNHGFEIEGPPQNPLHLETGTEYRQDLEDVRARIEERVGGISGLLIEDKRLSLSVHYRLVTPDRVPTVKRTVDEIVADFPRLRRHSGKKVYEIRPRVDWHKGRALIFVLEALGLDRPDVFPIYLGDDVTDEDAFAVIKGRGLGVLVSDSPHASAADYIVRDPAEVKRFLDQLIEGLGRSDV